MRSWGNHRHSFVIANNKSCERRGRGRNVQQPETPWTYMPPTTAFDGNHALQLFGSWRRALDRETRSAWP